MKIQRTEVINMFLHLCNDMNKIAYITESELKSVKKWATEHWEAPCKIVHTWTIGAWMLHNASCYGGWVIQECHNQGGGIDNPLGQNRYPLQIFYTLISFARQTLWLKKQESRKDFENHINNVLKDYEHKS